MSALPLLSIAYAPPLSYYKLLSLGPCSVEVHETYQKQTFRNRCRILTPQGVEDLVIPIEQGARQDCPIREVRISSHDHWWTRHLQALKSAYGKSPFFEFYIDDIASLYERGRHSFLFDFNWELMGLLARLIHLPLSVELTDSYQSAPGVPLDYREAIHPKRLEETFFPFPTYYHRFPIKGAVTSGVSIFDLLFNMGPESILVLSNCQIDLF